jgi:hypothetical protein
LGSVGVLIERRVPKMLARAKREDRWLQASNEPRLITVSSLRDEAERPLQGRAQAKKRERDSVDSWDLAVQRELRR